MKRGDVVMFIDKGTYAKWFFGQVGVIEHGPSLSKAGEKHIRVKWIQPIPYFDRMATISDFAASKFEVAHEAQTLTK